MSPIEYEIGATVVDVVDVVEVVVEVVVVVDVVDDVVDVVEVVVDDVVDVVEVVVDDVVDVVGIVVVDVVVVVVDVPVGTSVVDVVEVVDDSVGVDDPTTVITCFDPVPRVGEYRANVCSPDVRFAGIVPVNVPPPSELLVTQSMTCGFDATTNCTISLGVNPEKVTET